MSELATSIGVEECESANYDLALFASGYEERSSFLAARIDPSKVDRRLVLGFTTLTETPSRRENDQAFLDRWSPPVMCAADDDRLVLDALASLPVDRQLRVLVDFSSMSRNWYGAVLNWLATYQQRHQVQVDFAYSVGTSIAPYDPLPILEIRSVPGFEGASLKNRVVLILGLGFDALAPFSVLEQMEPTRVMAFVAAPGAASWYVEECLRVNASLLAEHVAPDALIMIPLNDVPRSISLLAEASAPLLAHNRVVFVPMGP
jgi:hypothetical protein